MTNAYRNPDDLAAAQRRVAELEAEIAAIPPPQKPRSLIIMAVISSCLAIATIVASSILVFWIRGRDKAARDKANAEAAAAASPTTTTSATPPPKPTTRVYTQPYLPASRSPIYRDINDDGISDIIMLLWEGAAPDATSKLRVAAINGKNMDVIWEAGPWRATWAADTVTITEAGSYIVVTDTDGRVHSLDRVTGKKSHEWTLAESLTSQFHVCADPDGRANVAVFPSLTRVHEYDLGDKKELRSDAQRFKTLQAWCSRRYHERPSCSEGHRDQPCVRTNVPSSSSRSMRPSHSYEDDARDLLVTFGRATSNGAPYFVSQTRNNEALWEGAVVDGVSVAEDAPLRMQYDEGRVFALYQNKRGRLHLAGRDARSGSPLFTKTIDVSDTSTHDLDVIDGLQVIVRLPSSLRVYDVTGQEKRTIDKVTLDVEQ